HPRRWAILGRRDGARQGLARALSGGGEADQPGGRGGAQARTVRLSVNRDGASGRRRGDDHPAADHRPGRNRLHRKHAARNARRRPPGPSVEGASERPTARPALAAARAFTLDHRAGARLAKETLWRTLSVPPRIISIRSGSSSITWTGATPRHRWRSWSTAGAIIAATGTGSHSTCGATST